MKSKPALQILGPALLLLAVVPAAATAVVTMRFMYHVIYWDHWANISLIKEFLSGTLTLRDLMWQQNEHRLIFPRILMLCLIPWTHWDLRYEVACSLLFAGGTWLTYSLTVFRDKSFFPRPALWSAPLFFSLFVFSWRQYDNWMSAISNAYFLYGMASAAALYLLTAPVLRQRNLWIAGVLGVVGSGTFLPGLFIWPAGGLALLMREMPPPQKRRICLSAWLAAGFVTTACFLNGYVKPSYHPDLNFGFHDPSLWLRYFFNFLGGAFTDHYELAGLLGLLGFLFFGAASVFLFCTGGCSRRLLAAAMMPGVMALMTAAACAVGRSGFSAWQAMTSRYVTLSYPLWISCYLLAALLLSFSSTLKNRLFYRLIGPLWVSAVLCAALLTVQASIRAYPKFPEKQRAVHRGALELLEKGENISEKRIYPNRGGLEEAIQFLKEHRLNIFDPPQLERLKKTVL